MFVLWDNATWPPSTTPSAIPPPRVVAPVTPCGTYMTLEAQTRVSPHAWRSAEHLWRIRLVTVFMVGVVGILLLAFLLFAVCYKNERISDLMRGIAREEEMTSNFGINRHAYTNSSSSPGPANRRSNPDIDVRQWTEEVPSSLEGTLAGVVPSPDSHIAIPVPDPTPTPERDVSDAEGGTLESQSVYGSAHSVYDDNAFSHCKDNTPQEGGLCESGDGAMNTVQYMRSQYT